MPQVCQTYALYLEGLPAVLWDALPPALQTGLPCTVGRLQINFFNTLLRKGHATGTVDGVVEGAAYESNLHRLVRCQVC